MLLNTYWLRFCLLCFVNMKLCFHVQKFAKNELFICQNVSKNYSQYGVHPPFRIFTVLNFGLLTHRSQSLLPHTKFYQSDYFFFKWWPSASLTYQNLPCHVIFINCDSAFGHEVSVKSACLCYFWMIQDRAVSYYGIWICMQSIEWCYFQWPWVT